MAGLFGEDPAPAATGVSLFGDATPTAPETAPAYRVLARKYRPRDFATLIGQEALVRTLRNAFAMDRLAHAFMLTGVRGVGKTTTARILARAVNCTGPDGAGGPTPDPCGVCDNCVAILADRHPDVVEMDAASNTGIDDVREIIEATRFKPMSARTKFFIIDEVHMLSRQAFNALLKTLEEPPPHIKFVLATTEIRKVPVTVLSRCQRFDLRRVPVGELVKRFKLIVAQEGVAIADAALDHIARAADGSVRDGLSLLDQAIARGTEDGGEIGGTLVAEMLGLADRTLTYALLEAVVKGEAAQALSLFDTGFAFGADPGTLLTDLLNLTHLLTRLKVAPALAAGDTLPELDRERGGALADRLSVPWLGRMWQMLLKGVAEVEAAPDRRAAAEMILIRLCHVADLPPPAELIRRLTDGAGANGPAATPPPPGSGIRAVANGAPWAEAAPVPTAPLPATPVPAGPRSFIEVVTLAQARRDATLAAHLRHSVHLVRFAPPVLELRPQPEAPRDLPQRLAALLEAESGRRWTIALSHAEGAPTLEETETAERAAAQQQAARHPLVLEIMRVFPGARLETAPAGPAFVAPPVEDGPDLPPELPPDWADAPPPNDMMEED